MEVRPYKASAELEAWILRSAPAHFAVEMEVGWQDLLVARWANRSIPVSTLNSDNTIFSSRRVNWAMRALHDQLHLTLGRGFDYESEIAVSLVTVELAFRAGLGVEDQQALAFDGSGQTEFHAWTGRFPRRQDLWVAECFLHVRYSDAINSYIEKGYDNA